MVRRMKNLNKSLLRYYFWKKKKNNRRLKKSFCQNFFLTHKPRITFFVFNKYWNRHHRFYYSQNKLQCFLHYSFSVPSQKTRVSRFFLTKGVERLMFGGYQK